MKNLNEFNKFKNLKKGKLNEDVIPQGDLFKVWTSIDVPVSLINGYMKKVKDETGEKLEDRFGKSQIAEMLISYLTQSFLNIENFPVTIVTGEATKVQPQAQVQPQVQVQEPQAQPQGQNVQAQATAQEIPATQGGQAQGQAQGGQTQTQGQAQGGQAQGGQTQSQEI